MAIVNKNSKPINVMTETRTYFDLGVPFMYSPLADKSVHLVIEARDVREHTNGELIDRDFCETHCALSKWCATDDNYDSNGTNYIPECEDCSREDGAQVYFVKLWSDEVK